MATQTGTATSYLDLLDKLRDFLVDTVGWTELEYSGIPSPSTGNATLHLRAPAGSSGNEFFLNIRTDYILTNNSYGWRVNAAQDYDADLDDISQQGASPYVYFNTWQNSISYWFYGNSRRVIVVAKVNTSYVSFYAGCFLPYAMPTEYLRPFAIIANDNQLAPYDVSNSRNQFIANPGVGSAYYLDFAMATWTGIDNSQDSATYPIVPTAARDAVMWPHRALNNYSVSATAQAGDWSYEAFQSMRPNLQGEMPQWLCHILSAKESKMVGALEGVYSSPGFGRTSEQLIAHGGDDFRLFQNIYRTTPRDFMSILEG